LGCHRASGATRVRHSRCPAQRNIREPTLNWNRKLNRPVHVLKYGTVDTQSDARHLVFEVIPAEFRNVRRGSTKAGTLVAAAEGATLSERRIVLELAIITAAPVPSRFLINPSSGSPSEQPQLAG